MSKIYINRDMHPEWEDEKLDVFVDEGNRPITANDYELLNLNSVYDRKDGDRFTLRLRNTPKKE